jgi:hypothetical protein
MVSQLLGQLGEHALHFAVFFSYHFHNLLDLCVDVMAKLAGSIGWLSGDLSNGVGEFFVGCGKGFFEIVDVVDDFVGDVAGQLLEVELGAQAHLNLWLDHFSDLFNQFALMVLVEIIFFPQILLNSPDFSSHVGLLLFPTTSLSLQLCHHAPELILHSSVQRPYAFFFSDEFVPDKGIHGVILGLIFHFLAHLFFGHYAFSKI